MINTDDQYGKRLTGLAKKTVTYGLESDADITTKKFQLTFNGLAFTAQTPNGKVQVASPLVGRINVYNILAAIGAAQALGLSTEIIEAGIRVSEAFPGASSGSTWASHILWSSTTRTQTTRSKI